MKKTADYTMNAINRYNEKKDIAKVLFPKGTKDRIKAAGYSINGFVNEAVKRMLDELEVTEEEKPVEVKKTEPVNLTELQKVLDQKIAARKMGAVDLEKEEVRKASKMEAEKLDSEE